MAAIKVWPLIIAVCEPCFMACCPECGCMAAPQSFVEHVGLCPQCGGGDVRFSPQKHAHHWPMLLRSTRGMPGWAAAKLGAVAHIPRRHRMGVHEWFEPCDDEATAIVEYSREVGLLMRGDRA